jgi:hypothetical protein
LPHRPRPLLIISFTLIACLYLLYLASVIWLTIRAQTAPGPQIYTTAHILPQNDFAMFWYSGVLLFDHAAGLSPSPWMLKTFQFPMVAPGPAFHLTWMYPPPMGLLAILYSSLPLGAGYWIFRVVFLITAAALYRRAGLTWPAILLGLAGPASLHDAFAGQNGTLTGALLVTSLLLLEKSPRLAGALAGLLCIKPQIALSLPFILLRKAHRPALIAAAACFALIALATLPIEGLSAWTWFFLHARGSSTAYVARPFSQDFPAAGITTFFMARSLHASETLAWACQAITSLAAAYATARLWRRPAADPLARVAITLCLWVLLTPYGYMYDLAGFSVVMAALCLRAPNSQKPLYALLWLAAGYTGTIANLTGLITTPLIAAAGALAIWRFPPNATPRHSRESGNLLGPGAPKNGSLAMADADTK